MILETNIKKQFKAVFYTLVLCVLVVMAGCKGNEPQPQPAPNATGFPLNYALILNEGTYNWGNSSVSIWDLDADTLLPNVFQSVNHAPLGDVLQSAYLFNGLWYLVLNNSGKVEVVNSRDFKSISTITGFTSPRYFQPVSNSKAYVTDLYSNYVWVVNLSTNSIDDSIFIGGATEELIVRDTNAYILSSATDRILQIDIANDSIIDSSSVLLNPESMTLDGLNRIWVLDVDLADNSYTPQLAMFGANLADGTIDSYVFSGPLASFNPIVRYDKVSDRILLNASNQVLGFDASQNLIPNAEQVLVQNKIWYGMGTDTTSGAIFVSDPKSFIEDGTVYQYDNSGELQDSMEVGIIPSEVYFYHP